MKRFIGGGYFKIAGGKPKLDVVVVDIDAC